MTKRQIQADLVAQRKSVQEWLLNNGFQKANHWRYETPPEHTKQIIADFFTSSDNVVIVYNDYNKTHRIREVIEIVGGFIND